MSALLLATDPDLQAKVEAAVSQTRAGLVTSMVKRVLAEPRADLSLGLGLVTAENKKNGLTLLAGINTSLGADYRKISNLALLGVELCGLHSLCKQRDQFRDLYMRACWGKKLSELDISFKAAFNGSKSECVEVLRLLVAHPQAEISLLLQFARAFKIIKNDVLTLYSEARLKKLEARVNNRGEVVVENLEDVTAKVERCLDMIQEDRVLYEHLTKLFSEVSPYNYAVLEFILKKLYQTKVYRDEKPQFLLKADKILGFLMQYRRVSEPQAEAEVDNWIKERSCPLPVLAQRRLPLYSLVMLPVKEKYKWLEKEFSLDTYKSWMSVAKVLGLAGDNICYFAVKNTVQEMMENNAKEGLSLSGEDWVMGHVNKNILESIQECIRSMTNSEKATAASHWVVNRLPKGKDKVLASIGAETVVQSWFTKMEDGGVSDTVRTGLEISKKTRRQLEAEQVLNKHGLTDQKYIDLVYHDKPLELLLQLFEDPSIETRTRAAAGNFPDINAAADSIASIHEINITSVKHELLDKWLPVSGSGGGGGLDDTMADFTLNLNTLKSEDQEDNVNSVNLIRCVYLQAGEGQGDGGLQYLLKFGFSPDQGVSTQHKLRALKCLFSVCSDKRLEEVTGRKVDSIRQYMKSLVYLSRLESLNLPYTLASLEAVSKTSLVESVWRVAKASVEGVLLVRDLCAEYEIWGPGMWATLLDRMIALALVSELTTTLLLLNSRPQIWNSPQFLRAWNLVLHSPFRSVVPPASRDQKALCDEAFKLINFCPTATDLDLKTLGKSSLSSVALNRFLLFLIFFQF